MEYLEYLTQININNLPNILEFPVSIRDQDGLVNMDIRFLSIPRPAFIYKKIIMALEMNKYRFCEQYAITYNKDGFIQLAVLRKK